MEGHVGEAEHVPCTMRDLLRYFLRLGALGFGGPIALAGYMQRDLVEERRWFLATDYKEGLALSQLSPGPLAGQLATGAIAGAAFVLGRRAIVDMPTLVIAAAVLAALLTRRKIPEPLLILAAGLAGFTLKRALGT